MGLLPYIPIWAMSLTTGASTEIAQPTCLSIYRGHVFEFQLDCIFVVWAISSICFNTLTLVQEGLTSNKRKLSDDYMNWKHANIAQETAQ